MSERDQSTQNEGKNSKTWKDFYYGLANAFEAQGNLQEAQRYRDLAQRQSELRSKGIARMATHSEKERQAEWEEVAKQPTEQGPLNDPDFFARSFDVAFQAKMDEVANMSEPQKAELREQMQQLQERQRNQRSPAPNASEGPTPLGGN